MNDGFDVRQDRKVFADHDDRGLYVYQAFCPLIAHNALEKGTFGDGFGLRRMTWIKPSFGWMLYRSNYGNAANQQVILRIHLSHEGFGILLRESVLATYDPNVYESESDWRARFEKSKVRVQWDPDRNLALGRYPDRKAIQIGIGPGLVRDYVDHWVISLADVTKIGKNIQKMVGSGLKASQIQHPYAEREYEVPTEIMVRLGMVVSRSDNKEK